LDQVSVIVSTYQRPRALGCVLYALSHQSKVPAEIIIADDGSSLDTKKIIDLWRDQGLPVTHCWQEDRGFRKTAILNQAISATSNPYLIFLDGDCIPLRHFVRDHLRLAQRGYTVAGTRTLTSERLAQRIELENEQISFNSWRYWLLERLRGNINTFFPALTLPDASWRGWRGNQWRGLRGCNFAVFTSDIKAVGGFDESITGWGKEDSDLAVRLLNSGLKIKSGAFAARVLHLWHPEESRSSLDKNDRHLQKTLAEKRIKPIVGVDNSVTSPQ
jgi:glycosyltransferase involved in cell wall biosynthesis